MASGSMTEKGSRPFYRSPQLWIFLVALAVRLFSLGALSSSPGFFPGGGDTEFYHNWAVTVSKGELSDGQAFYGLPGYAYLVGFLYWLGGHNPYIPAFLQCMADAGLAVLIFNLAMACLARGSGEGATASPGVDSRLATALGVAAAAGWILFQPAQTASIILMPTTLAVLAFWGVVWLVLGARPSDSWKTWLFVGLVIGVTSTMVATVLFLLPLVLVAALLREWKAEGLKRGLSSIGLVLVGVLFGTSPCWVHNYLIVREPVFLSAHGGINLWIGNNPAANGYPRMPPGLRAGQMELLKDSIRRAEHAKGKELSRAEVSRYWTEKAGAYISANRREWLGLLGRKIANFWNRFQYDDLSLMNYYAEERLIFPGLRFGIVALLALPGAMVAAFAYPATRWVTAAVLLQMAALLSVFVTERYRLAAVPGLLVLAVAGVAFFGQKLSARRWGPGAAYALGVVLAYFVVSQPRTDPHLFTHELHNSGLRSLEAGDLDAAQAKLERANDLVPDNSETCFALGNLWLERGDSVKARQFYRQAIDLNLFHSGALNNLGIIAMDEEEWPLAERLLSMSLTAEPEDANTRYMLAKVKMKRGDLRGARLEVERALLRQPGREDFAALLLLINQTE